jgi:gamma-glutamyl phosphate reductase
MGFFNDIGLGFVETVFIGEDADTIKALEISSNKKLKLRAILNEFTRYQARPTIPKIKAVINIIENLTIDDKKFQQRLEKLKQRAREVQTEIETELNKEKPRLRRLNQKLKDIITN